MGARYLTDYDTINVNVPPSPNCDFMPFDGQLTTHDDYVPARWVRRSAEEYDRVARATKEVDINVVMPEIGQKMVSDMYLLQYFDGASRSWHGARAGVATARRTGCPRRRATPRAWRFR